MVNALQHWNASGPSILPRFQIDLSTAARHPAEVLDVLKQGLRPRSSATCYASHRQTGTSYRVRVLDLLGGLPRGPLGLPLSHAHDGPTLCKAVLMQESGRLALGAAAGLLWMHAFTDSKALWSCQLRRRSVVVALSLAPGLRTQPMTTPLRGVKDVGGGVTLVFGGDECPQGAWLWERITGMRASSSNSSQTAI
jgi:hypothetical protein